MSLTHERGCRGPAASALRAAVRRPLHLSRRCVNWSRQQGKGIRGGSHHVLREWAAAGSATLLPKAPPGKRSPTLSRPSSTRVQAAWLRSADKQAPGCGRPLPGKDPHGSQARPWVPNTHQQQGPAPPKRPLLLSRQLQSPLPGSFFFFLLQGSDRVLSYLESELRSSPRPPASLLTGVKFSSH